ncbi:hypothetical protein Lal_00039016 [Lupinus albus]|nr:hypothetical protein Lal_00039016 [Lupinus albus]
MYSMQTWQRYQARGGGEKNGIDGKVVGIEGMLGNEVAGNGGRLTCGSVGIVVGMFMVGSGGKVVGMFMLGSGGKVVGLGRDGIVGKVGITLPPPCGNVGTIEGTGGNAVGLGKVGMVGKFGVVVVVVCNR